MRDEILNKLAAHLEKTFERESDVVYLLVEIRKLFERDGALGANLSTLQFYCNWALHSQLTGSQAQRFLVSVLPVLTMEEHTPEQYSVIDQLLTLSRFREELNDFLSRSGLKSGICTSQADWQNFLRLYSGVVSDSELQVVNENRVASHSQHSVDLSPLAQPSGPFQLVVDSLCIRKRDDEIIADHPFPMTWHLRYRNCNMTAELELGHLGLSGAVLRTHA